MEQGLDFVRHVGADLEATNGNGVANEAGLGADGIPTLVAKDVGAVGQVKTDIVLGIAGLNSTFVAMKPIHD